jgi:glycosyltransferase involved in cell wall biosynthesis
MPVYNAEKYINDSIVSVINQTFLEWELLIVDDCSTDNSLKIINFYEKKDKRIKKFLLNKNQGVGAARNIGIKNSSGDFLAFLDSDDIWNVNKLEIQYEFMKKNEILFSYTHYNIFGSSDKIFCPYKINYELMLISCFIGCSTVIINKKNIENFFFEEFKIRNDWAFWLRILKSVKTGYGLPIITTHIRKNKGSLSSSKIKNLLFYFKIMLHEKQNPIKIFFFLLPIYMLIQFFKKYITRIYNLIINLTY